MASIILIHHHGRHYGTNITRQRQDDARLWFLPPYSPDLSPIEQAFANVKHWMRIAQRRNIDDAWRQVGDIVDTFKENECENYFTNAGYASVKT